VPLLRVIVFALTGLAFGSFLTVVIHRVPRKESIVLPGSACPSCGVAIRPRDNIPVLSYVLLRGKCRNCHTRISPQYPLIEALTAALFVFAAIAFHRLAVAALIAPFLGLMVALALIDARHRIIPNRIVYPALAVFAVAVLAVALWSPGLSLATAGLGLLVYGGSLFVVALLFPAGMGMGDVKLAALIGLVLGGLGWRYVGTAAMLGVLAGGVGAVVALMRGAGRKDTIPFGPYMAAGAVLAALLAPHLIAWYPGLGR
jgi:leader peptidase (prepilin peptidase) / N-methyltransferase